MTETLIGFRPTLDAAYEVVARIDDNTYWDDQVTLRTIDRSVEPYARWLIALAEAVDGAVIERFEAC